MNKPTPTNILTAHPCHSIFGTVQNPACFDWLPGESVGFGCCRVGDVFTNHNDNIIWGIVREIEPKTWQKILSLGFYFGKRVLLWSQN